MNLSDSPTEAGNVLKRKTEDSDQRSQKIKE